MTRQKWRCLAGPSSGAQNVQFSRLTAVACMDFWSCISYSRFCWSNMLYAIITTPAMQREAPAWLWQGASCMGMEYSCTCLTKALVLALAGPLKSHLCCNLISVSNRAFHSCCKPRHPVNRCINMKWTFDPCCSHPTDRPSLQRPCARLTGPLRLHDPGTVRCQESCWSAKTYLKECAPNLF